MSDYVQLCGSDDPLSLGSVALWTPSFRMLCNCPEGLQRFLPEIQFKFSRVSLICLTRIVPGTIMGLPGLLLTMNESGCKQIHVSGPSQQLEKFMDLIIPTCFEHRKMNISLLNPSLFSTINPLGSFSHPLSLGSLRLCAIPCGDSPPSHSKDASVYSFLIWRIPDRHFNSGKAKALGVPPGKLFGLLKSGQRVTLENGRIIEADEVLDEPKQKVTDAILLMDYADSTKMPHIHLLESSLQLHIHTIIDLRSQHLSQCKPEDLTHLPGRNIVRVPQCTLKRSTAFPTSLAHRHHLSLLFPHNTLATFHRGPPEEEPTWPYQHRFPLCSEQSIEQLKMNFPTRQVALQMLSSNVPQVTASIPNATLCDNDAVCVFLGTGAMMPSKYRNVSSVAFRLPVKDTSWILCDVGEGTTGQLWNALYDFQLSSFLRNIRLVFISHLHADHHLGLVSFLSLRYHYVRHTKDPVTVVAPASLIKFVRILLQVIDMFSSDTNSTIAGIENIDFRFHKLPDISPTSDNSESSFQLQLPAFSDLCFTVLPMLHSASPYGCIVRSSNESAHSLHCSFAYSGDTEPNVSFAQLARGIQLFVHEATFADSMKADAQYRQHSTVGDALEIAAKAKVKHVCLTHFSQRYPKFPVKGALSTEADCSVCFAFDFLMLRRPSDVFQISQKAEELQTLEAEYTGWESGITKRLRTVKPL